MPSQRRVKSLLIIALLLAAALFLDRAPLGGRIFSFFIRGKNKAAVIKHFSFSDPDSLEEWDEKVLRRRVTYRIDSSADMSYVHAISDRSCSAMYYKIRLGTRHRPVLSWKWRIGKFPDKKSPDDISSKEEDDFAARVYVIFKGLFFSNSKVLEYIWAKDLEVGTISSSPYSNNIKLIVAQSGPNEENAWVFEERDIYNDYVSAFHSKPNFKIGSIAFMCDSDSTKSSAEAYFDEIKISLKGKE